MSCPLEQGLTARDVLTTNCGGRGSTVGVEVGGGGINAEPPRTSFNPQDSPVFSILHRRKLRIRRTYVQLKASRPPVCRAKIGSYLAL
jgi:hypothetical protein